MSGSVVGVGSGGTQPSAPLPATDGQRSSVSATPSPSWLSGVKVTLTVVGPPGFVLSPSGHAAAQVWAAGTRAQTVSVCTYSVSFAAMRTSRRFSFTAPVFASRQLSSTSAASGVCPGGLSGAFHTFSSTS